jgi:hypothetical protein
MSLGAVRRLSTLVRQFEPVSTRTISQRKMSTEHKGLHLYTAGTPSGRKVCRERRLGVRSCQSDVRTCTAFYSA